jgi:hypothetical protein
MMSDATPVTFTADLYLDGVLTLRDVRVTADVCEQTFVDEPGIWHGRFAAKCLPDRAMELQQPLLAAERVTLNRGGRHYEICLNRAGVSLTVGERSQVTGDFEGVGEGPSPLP